MSNITSSICIAEPITKHWQDIIHCYWGKINNVASVKNHFKLFRNEHLTYIYAVL